MNIFEIVNDQVTFSPQALVLKPLKEIWDNDSSPGKGMAVAELSYVYYMADDRSDFQYILDEEERHDQVVLFVNGLDENYIVPQYVKDAMEFYVEISQTTSTRLLASTRGVIAKITHFLDVIDVNERDQRTNKPVFDIGKIVASVEKIPKLVRAVNEIEQEVIKEKELKAQTGNRESGMFDDTGI